MVRTLAAAAIITLAGSAGAQAITSVVGGSPFDIYHGGSTGDAIGYRFTVNSNITVTNVGMLNSAATDGIIDSSHAWGIWDSSQALLGSGTINPANGFQQGDFFYDNNSAGVNLAPGETYTIAVIYASLDGDSYVSSPSSVGTSADVNLLNGVFPSTGNLGLAFPTEDSANLGRFGPNFNYVPAPASAVLLGLGGLAACRRRR